MTRFCTGVKTEDGDVGFGETGFFETIDGSFAIALAMFRPKDGIQTKDRLYPA